MYFIGSDPRAMPLGYLGLHLWRVEKRQNHIFICLPGPLPWSPLRLGVRASRLCVSSPRDPKRSGDQSASGRRYLNWTAMSAVCPTRCPPPPTLRNRRVGGRGLQASSSSPTTGRMRLFFGPSLCSLRSLRFNSSEPFGFLRYLQSFDRFLGWF